MNRIISKAEPALKDAQGELTTEELFNSHLRVANVNQIIEMIRGYKRESNRLFSWK